MMARNVLIMMCLLLVADESQRHQRVGGMDVYFGAVPSEIIRDHPGMHGGKPEWGTNNYHILIALFDSAGGKRITDANITAAVTVPTWSTDMAEAAVMQGIVIVLASMWIPSVAWRSSRTRATAGISP